MRRDCRKGDYAPLVCANGQGPALLCDRLHVISQSRLRLRCDVSFFVPCSKNSLFCVQLHILEYHFMIAEGICLLLIVYNSSGTFLRKKLSCFKVRLKSVSSSNSYSSLESTRQKTSLLQY